MKIEREQATVNATQWSAEIHKLLAAQASAPEAPPKVIDGFEIPVWWECSWRRIRCNLQTCRFCRTMWASETKTSAYIGELVQDDELSGATGRQNPHDIIIESDAEELSGEEWEEFRANEPPDADRFLLHRRIMFWLNPLVRYLYPHELRGDAWAKSDAAQDLLWYATLLPSKVYRQLSTKWEVARSRDDEDEQEFGRIETGYTGYCVRECVRLIEQSLVLLSREDMHPPLQTVLAEFRRFKPSIIALCPRRG